MASGHDSRRRGGTFVDVDLAGLVRIQDFEGLLEARWVQEERQVVLAARRQEPDHRLVAPDGIYDLLLGQRPAVVLVDELEALARGVFELEREFFDLLAGRLCVELASLGALLELGRERGLDRFLPARNVDQLAAKPPVPPREMRRRRHKVSGSETHHSMASIVPSLSVSSTANAASSRDGTNRYWRFLLPQFVRKLITS